MNPTPLLSRFRSVVRAGAAILLFLAFAGAGTALVVRCIVEVAAVSGAVPGR